MSRILPQVDIGVVGGTGLYELLDNPRELRLDTPWGAPSAAIALGELDGCRVAFLPRHGASHAVPPHLINFRANIDAMRQLGVRALLAPSVVGSLRPAMAPGHFVVCDQLVDRTWGRADTFFEGPEVVHASFADPYDERLRQVLVAQGRQDGLVMHDGGVAVAIQGPRFSTRAESRWFAEMGWDVLSMTQHPEAVLAREAAIPYAMVGMVSDYDVGVTGGEPVTQLGARAVIRANVDKQRGLILRAIPAALASVVDGRDPGGATPDPAR